MMAWRFFDPLEPVEAGLVLKIPVLNNSLKLTAKKAPKNDGFPSSVHLLFQGSPIFRAKLLVSGRV